MSYDIDFEKIDRDLEEWNDGLEERRRERVAQGLPPDSPEPFLPIPSSSMLAKEIAPVRAIIAKYAHLVQESGEVLPINTDSLQQYKADAELLHKSQGLFLAVYGMGVYLSICTLEKAAKKEISAEKLAKDLFVNLQLCETVPSGNLDSCEFNGAEYSSKQDEEFQRQFKRYEENDGLFNEELDHYRAYYESIRHLY